MSFNRCSGNFSSSLGSCQHFPGSFCGSSYPNNLLYSTGVCSPSNVQLGSSLYGGCQETFYKPSPCQNSCVVSSPGQASCYRSRSSTLCKPCQPTVAVSQGFGAGSGCSLGFGSTSLYSQGCGINHVRPVSCGTQGFSSQVSGSGFFHPNYLASGNCQSSCYRPTCGSGF
ncbi:keratin-associated protein 13-1-like [Echinops telfairi]|uniref:Keratin-associated protein n=1 Tax=Echinops telfairi TaxID=9371 RepID=A0ABM0J258_ECHTE|nr:keratin-associated protein 13-1-like [Echinops telfairi]